MVKFLKCIEECKAVIDFEPQNEKTKGRLFVKIHEGQIFCSTDSLGTMYILFPAKTPSGKNDVEFDKSDIERIKSFKMGSWDDIKDNNVIKQFKLNKVGDLSSINIEVRAPKSCFEKIK